MDNSYSIKENNSMAGVITMTGDLVGFVMVLVRKVGNKKYGVYDSTYDSWHNIYNLEYMHDTFNGNLC